MKEPLIGEEGNIILEIHEKASNILYVDRIDVRDVYYQYKYAYAVVCTITDALY